MIEPIATTVPDLYRLPLPTPFPIGRINAYVAVGEHLTLIDTGVNSAKSYAALVAGLAALGATPADLRRIIITHHHTDHAGLVARLVEESGAEVWCHQQCVPYLEQPATTRAHRRAWSVQAWQEAGVPQPLIDLTSQLFAWFETLGTSATSVTCALTDGDVIELLGQTWTVLHTPGHAGDLICLHQPESGILLSSDHLIRDVSSNALMEPPQPGHKRPRRLIQYMAQLQRVADLAPRIAYAGHGDPVTDVPGLVEQRLAFHQKRADQLLALLKKQPEAVTLYQITEMMFGYVSDQEKFLALSEVLGHMDWLERDGLVTRIARDGRTYWCATQKTDVK